MNPSAASETAFVEVPAAVSRSVSATDERIAALTAGMTAGAESVWVEFHSEYFDRLFRYLLVVCCRISEIGARATGPPITCTSSAYFISSSSSSTRFAKIASAASTASGLRMSTPASSSVSIGNFEPPDVRNPR